MKKLISFIAIMIMVWAMVYLYQRQLGAISFFILSFIFFYLSYQQYKKTK